MREIGTEEEKEGEGDDEDTEAGIDRERRTDPARTTARDDEEARRTDIPEECALRATEESIERDERDKTKVKEERVRKPLRLFFSSFFSPFPSLCDLQKKKLSLPPTPTSTTALHSQRRRRVRQPVGKLVQPDPGQNKPEKHPAKAYTDNRVPSSLARPEQEAAATLVELDGLLSDRHLLPAVRQKLALWPLCWATGSSFGGCGLLLLLSRGRGEGARPGGAAAARAALEGGEPGLPRGQRLSLVVRSSAAL